MRTQPREIIFTKNINPHALGSVLAEFGRTKVYITASVEDTVPSFLKNQGTGWSTAEYSMLPGATHTRKRRERSKVSGRTMEIQRLIGRSLRSIIDLKTIGERTITFDCDVLVADGGTRTASISGAYVALVLAMEKLKEQNKIQVDPITNQIAAVSVGIHSTGEIMADLNYEEDSSCQTDMNIVMTKSGEFVEIQGTAETKPFSQDQFADLLHCAKSSLKSIFEKQHEALYG